MCCFGPRDIDNNHRTGKPDSALEICDRRYVLGEIDNEEYEEKKRTLTASSEFIND